MKTDSNDGRGKVLLIDDESDFRQVIAKSLLKHRFEVIEAADGNEGLRRAAESLPDLILCDLLMPRMNGYEVLAALRQDERLAGIPIIFLTAQSEPAEVRQAMNLGADDYLTKPANLLDLLGAITARLERRQSERQKQQKQMERAMQLFAETVHDLRNPLFAVFAYTDLLRNAARAPARDQQRSEQIFAGMQQAVARMQDIVSETMYVVRSRMRPQPLNPSAFDLRNFCELLLADYEPCGRLQFHCGAGPFPLVADAPRLRHALENLLSNALKYSDGPVVVGLARAAQGYRIEVSDRGIGIPAEDQAGIFEPFFRASNTGAKPGHGLGLCVVQTCVQEHGGSISFVSEPSQGTTFALDLPASPPTRAARQGEVVPIPVPARKLPEPAGKIETSNDPPVPLAEVGASLPEGVTPARPKPPEPPTPAARLDAGIRPAEAALEAGGKMRAMVVEDDPVVSNVLRELLEGSNEVQVLGQAGTLAQALRLASQQKPALVFLDVNLPDGSGFDLLAHLPPNVSVVFVTSAEEYAAQAFDCEATDYLVKPVSSERLRQALRRVRQRLAGKAAAASRAASKSPGSFLVKTLTEKRLVNTSEIKSILAYGEYSWVYWDKSQKGALLRKSLKQWQSELPGEQFTRVHRRAIVNLAFMDRIERLPSGRLQVHLRDTAEPILVSLSQTPVLNRKLKALRG
jgi:DNA-binding response OmpR family regulator